VLQVVGSRPDEISEFFPRARGSVVVQALCYKLEGRRFETR
jgi:hypothetical protein